MVIKKHKDSMEPEGPQNRIDKPGQRKQSSKARKANSNTWDRANYDHIKWRK